MAYTISQVIEIASKRTERRVEGEIDLRSEFWAALSEFVLERRYPWRRKSFTFSTAVGTQQYDVSSAGLSPYGSLATDLYEIRTVYRVEPGPAFTELPPLVTEDQQMSALEATINGKPSAYMTLPVALQTLVFNVPADAIYKMRINYWAAPDPVLDSAAEVVPLVPPQLHWGLPIALERNLFRYLYGQNDPRTMLAEKRYTDFLAKAARMFSFTTNQITAWSVQDRAVIAVDATTSGADITNINRSA